MASEPAANPAAAGDLISFLLVLPDCRMRRGIRFPQWWMLLVAILAILSGQGSLVGMERFAKRHRQTLNELLGTDFGKSPSDSTFRLLLAQLDVAGFETLLRDWMAAQPGVAEGLDTLVCDGKTLRGSIAENTSGAAKFIAQVSLYSQTLGVAIAQTTYATDTGGEIQALRQLLEAVELEGVLVQADALQANRPFSSISPSAAPTS
ncbi:ISAs1 family transposase [Synechococcus sp. CBW1002]|uniref:ISAs1 family transposase n=1 Tax=unclassified Synechococcus TaxID=2626047 RepID=UPI0018CD30DC|nr:MULTISPECIES: ISAs1 family transposase [unclassified Synechococcus]QPN60274.1 ISAs1 family transposase [Synechococcus sp. CBW1002]QPN60333.1 ISAs1 family transposase [Synechococcus sp. CBW1002]QPN67951.1 ISAs1 family transposase [Synechococcus sp. CBW1006]